MKTGRPNIYVQIVTDLGGKATAREIYDYGIKNKLIRCEFSGCMAAIQVNLRRKNLYGKARENIYAPSCISDQIKHIQDCFEMLSKRIDALAEANKKHSPAES
jgi:hypothetical protein